uniref:Uncharacterized protein n=1 Tax=Leersia perrieri TaxID=77586 RepID=A0A0D9X2V4_9ORYZ
MAVKTLLLATALLLAGLATLGAEARIAAMIHGSVEASVTTAAIAARDFKVSIIAGLQDAFSGDNSPIPGTLTTTDSEGNFNTILNVTSSEMMASLVSNSSVVVTTSLPDTEDILTAPLVLRGVRTLADSLADSQIRAGLESVERIAAVNFHDLLDNTTTDLVSTTVNLLDLLARGSNDSFAATSYGVESSIAGFAVFGIGTLSTSAGN